MSATDPTSTGPPKGPGPRSDYLSILSGTSQNVVGIAVAALGTFGAQILMTNTLGAPGFGIVTVVTQAAFVLSFATRSGMDMAVLRDVAVEVGQGRRDRIRTPVARAVAIGTLVSAFVALIGWLTADQVRSVFSIDPDGGRWVVEAGAIGLPFLAAANIWLSATRGLKIMRYTLYVFWAGQPLVWLVLMLAGWQVSETNWMSVLAYSISWVLATVAAAYFWRRESKAWDAAPMEAGAMSRLFRYAGPRAPAALFSQLLFWTDLFVLTRYASDASVGIYSATLRAGQILVLFLTSVNLMFSPYVADLHNRGERDRLDKLFKTVTRWTLTATIPLFLLLTIAPGSVMRIFGPEFSEGQTALMILLLGQLVNIASGSVGFVLIMVGRTGWDLLVYAGSLLTSLVLAFWLAPRYGMEGAAIANAVTFAVANLARLLLVKRFVGIQPYDRHYGRILVPAAGAAVAMWAVHQLLAASWAVDVVATAAVGIVVYAGLLLAFGLTPAERRGLSGLLAKVRGT